jgi:DNA-binding response OmpR family regulator
MRILIVDDDHDVALSIGFVLENEGYIVDVYDNPRTALSKFKGDYYDLILLDIRMPDMNGFELYEQLKVLDRRCKVCFITAFEVYYQALREFNDSLDAKCFIRKPISIDILLKRVKEEISR